MSDRALSPVRSSAFLGKEIYEVLRQPRLILTLALGPFLILLLFGLGFRNEARAFRTVFVSPESDQLGQQIEEFATTLGPQLIYEGITNSQEAALGRLRRGEVDLVIAVPTDAEQSIRNNEQAVFTLYHNEIDPLQAGYVDYFGQIYVGEVNRRILERITAEGQRQAADVQADLSEARSNASGLRSALERGDVAAARQHQEALVNNVSALELAVGASLGVMQGVEETLGTTAEGSQAAAIAAQIAAIRESSNALSDLPDNRSSYAAEAQTATELENDLVELETSLAEFQNIDPHVLVSPFRSEARTAANVRLDITDFYAPGVMALLLQHLAVTFGALSVVRERQTNTVELFRVSPISPFEVLVGKYLSYMLFGGVLATLLTLLLVFGLGLPMQGNWGYYVLVIGALLFTSLGFGFVISLISSSDSQAVQLAMLVLLTSVFFSGFFMALYLLLPPLRIVSWSLPVTYGIQLLQSIVLRGLPPSPLLLGGLLAIGVLLFLVAWLLTGRLMARR
jgi:ABC-2 type transport system permease protein